MGLGGGELDAIVDGTVTTSGLEFLCGDTFTDKPRKLSPIRSDLRGVLLSCGGDQGECGLWFATTEVYPS